MLHQVIFVSETLIAQAHTRGFPAAEVTSGVSQFPHKPVTDQSRQTLQGAHISDDTNIDFLDRERGIFGALTHITGRNHIHGTPDAGTVDGGKHRLSTISDSAKLALEPEDFIAQGLALATFAGDRIIN